MADLSIVGSSSRIGTLNENPITGNYYCKLDGNNYLPWPLQPYQQFKVEVYVIT